MVARNLFGAPGGLPTGSPGHASKRRRESLSSNDSWHSQLESRAWNASSAHVQMGKEIEAAIPGSPSATGSPHIKSYLLQAYPSDWRLSGRLARRAVLKCRGVLTDQQYRIVAAQRESTSAKRKSHVIGRGGFGKVWMVAVPFAAGITVSSCVEKAYTTATSCHEERASICVPKLAIKRHGGRNWPPGLGLNPWVIREAGAGTELSIPKVDDDLPRSSATRYECASTSLPSVPMRCAWRSDAGGRRFSTAWELWGSDLGTALQRETEITSRTVMPDQKLHESYIQRGAGLLRSLAAVHSRGWLHGDVKADNLMLPLPTEAEAGTQTGKEAES